MAMLLDWAMRVLQASHCSSEHSQEL